MVCQKRVGTAKLVQWEVDSNALIGGKEHKAPVQRVPYHLVGVTQIHGAGLVGLVTDQREPAKENDIEQDHKPQQDAREQRLPSVPLQGAAERSLAARHADHLPSHHRAPKVRRHQSEMGSARPSIPSKILTKKR